VPDPTAADLLPADPPALMDRLPGADLYPQDEVELALHPTLTRVWCRRGRRGQRLGPAPGRNAKRVGFGLVDWRDGWLDWAVDDGAVPAARRLTRPALRATGPGRAGAPVRLPGVRDYPGDGAGVRKDGAAGVLHTPRRRKPPDSAVERTRRWNRLTRTMRLQRGRRADCSGARA
jgi:hypothetical protein